MKKVSLVITFLLTFFIFTVDAKAIFKHDASLSLKLSVPGEAPTCTIDPTELTNKHVTVTFSSLTGYYTQMKDNLGNFVDLEEDSVTHLLQALVYKNKDIEMRYRDSNNKYSPVSICSVTNIDLKKPTIEFIPNGNSVYQNLQSTSVKVKDDIAIDKIYYYLSTSNSTEPTSGWIEVDGEDKKEKLVEVSSSGETGVYYLWTKAADKAGNETIEVSEDFLLDNTPPTVSISNTSASSSNINLKVVASDADSGIDGYYYSLDDGATWTTKQSSGVYMFAGLKNATTYNIRVKVTDKAGNETISNKLIVTTADLGNITVSVDSESWSTYKTATISFEDPAETGVTYQYSTDGGNTWVTITSDSQVTYIKNGTFTIKMNDGINTEETVYPINHIDPIPVTINSIVAPSIDITPDSISVVVDAEDTGSDAERSGIKGYQYSCNNGGSYSEITTSNQHTCSGLEPDTSYTIKVKVIDNAGNITLGDKIVKTKSRHDIFLNGVSGDDNNNGSSPTNAVKTFEKAKSLVSKEGTIWICGTVSINNTETWNLDGYGTSNGAGIIKRWDGTSVPFTLEADKVAFTKTFINLTATTSNIILEDIVLDGGAIWTGATDPTLLRGTTNSGVNTVGRNPLILGNNGIVTINDGAIIQNNDVEAVGVVNNDYGGAIYINAGKLVMNGGIIRNNQTNGRSSDGGAISCLNGTVTINGGEIYGNRAGRWAGAIRSRYFFLTNGVIRNNKVVADVNYATPGYGGALYINNNSSITGGEIKDNYAVSNGGGIYLASGTLNLSNTTITNNESLTLGSGIYYYNGTINLSGTVKIADNVNVDTMGDVYLPNAKKLTVTGDLTGSEIGILTATKPTAATTVDVVLPASSYVMNNTYYNQFTSNVIPYETVNSVYNTTNNKVVLKLK